jgi:hypothetical protein
VKGGVSTCELILRTRTRRRTEDPCQGRPPNRQILSGGSANFAPDAGPVGPLAPRHSTAEVGDQPAYSFEMTAYAPFAGQESPNGRKYPLRAQRAQLHRLADFRQIAA